MATVKLSVILSAKLSTKLASASYLEMYAIGCISRADLEYILKRSFNSLTQEERNYIDYIKKHKRYGYYLANGGRDQLNMFGCPSDLQVDIQTDDFDISVSIYDKYFK